MDLGVICYHLDAILKSIVKNNAFIILTSIGLLNLIIDMMFSTGNFGQKNLPVTYSVIELISGNLQLFIMGVFGMIVALFTVITIVFSCFLVISKQI